MNDTAWIDKNKIWILPDEGGGVVIANNNYTEMKYGDKVLMDSFSV